jgi:6-phosphogluconolactonase
LPNDGFYFAYVGCRTTRERNARGDGIAVFRVDRQTGLWTQIQLVGELLNPSFLAFGQTRRCLYTVHGDASEVSAFGVDPATGMLRFINRASTHGKNPVHLTTDPTNRFLVIANHLTTPDYESNIAVLALGEDGSIGTLTDLIALKGKIGPHRVEQPFPKPHQVQYDPGDRFIVVPDKGCDLVRTYTLDTAGKLAAIAASPAVAREEAGPRHVAFHPALPFAYVINELDSTVTAYRFDRETGALAPFQLLSSLPDDFTGNSRGSEIAVSGDGRFVYASNRGDDSIAAFAVDPANGRLRPAGWHASGGKTPRFFTLSPNGRQLFAANEDSDTITAFRLDRATGRLTEAGIAARTGSPTCIVFLSRTGS